MRLALLLLAACRSGAPAERPIANSTPPPRLLEMCEDTIVGDPPRTELGFVIDEATLLERTLRANEAVLRNCYAQRLAYKPYLRGRVEIQLSVVNGKATRIRMKGFDEEMDRCLCEKLSAMTFEYLSESEVKASYPLYFTPPAM